jgi:hypothetical protein
MMMDLTIYKGIAWQRTLTVADDDTGELADLDGAEVTFTVAKRTINGYATAIVALSVGSGVTIGEALGTAVLDLDAEQTGAIDEGQYHAVAVVTLPGKPPRVVTRILRVHVRALPV